MHVVRDLGAAARLSSEKNNNLGAGFYRAPERFVSQKPENPVACRREKPYSQPDHSSLILKMLAVLKIADVLLPYGPPVFRPATSVVGTYVVGDPS